MSDKYAFIAAERASVEPAPTVAAMCAGLGVSRSGFYDWQHAEPSARQLRRAKVTAHVHAAFDAGRGSYGVRRVHAILTRSADPEVASVSLDLVRVIVRAEGWSRANLAPTRSPPSRTRAPNRSVTTSSGTSPPTRRG